MAAVNNNVVDPNKKQAASSNTNGNAVPGNTPASSGVSTPTAATTPTNETTIYDNPTVKPTDREMEYIYNLYGIDSSGEDTFYRLGGYTQDREEALAHGAEDKTHTYFDGTTGWYLMPGEEKIGADTPDETFMSDADWALSQKASAEWFSLEELKKQAAAEGRTDLVEQYTAKQKGLNNMMNKVRAKYGYNGGVDGTRLDWIDTGDSSDESEYGHGKRPASGSGSGSGSDPNSELKGLLDAWQQAALKQSDGRIDYAVQKAVTDLERALADAQPMFKEQAETVAREERQALDNSALYAEMRGDKGGIGQEQYNSIQNTAAQNHLTVQQAQTKLATDTQRQIADLRAQGEFEKADAALQITQQYLQQLIGLEQWAAEYNLSVDQFNESVRQWEAEYNMAMQQLQISQSQWQAEFDAAQNRWQAEFDYGKQSDMANIGWALLESGVSLSKEQLAAMGIDEAQASQILMQQQLKSALKGNDTNTQSAFFDNALDWSQKMLKNGSRPAEIRAYLEGLVDRGQITADESVHIYMDYLGLLINDFSDADSIPTTNTPTLKETLKMA